MLVYWSMYLIPASLALARLRIGPVGWWGLGAPLTVIMGLRYEVGGDWGAYADYLQRASESPFLLVLTYKDPGYQVLNWLVALFGADVWLVNLTAAMVFVVGLIRFIKRLPDPRVALALAIPYMTIVMAMGYTRQAMAFGFMLWGLTYLIERRILAFVLVIGFASLFHKSAVILVPLAVLSNTKNKAWTAVWVGLTGIVLYLLVLQEHVDALWQSYVVNSYGQSSDGGPVRVAMNALPAVLFILLRKRFNMRAEERALWFWMSMFSLLCVPLVAWAPTAVDRVALYFMPIQLVFYSYLPELFRADNRVMARLPILALYGTVMYVWLNYAGHSYAWLPYQLWPFFQA